MWTYWEVWAYLCNFEITFIWNIWLLIQCFIFITAAKRQLFYVWIYSLYSQPNNFWRNLILDFNQFSESQSQASYLLSLSNKIQISQGVDINKSSNCSLFMWAANVLQKYLYKITCNHSTRLRSILIKIKCYYFSDTDQNDCRTIC